MCQTKNCIALSRLPDQRSHSDQLGDLASRDLSKLRQFTAKRGRGYRPDTRHAGDYFHAGRFLGQRFNELLDRKLKLSSNEFAAATARCGRAVPTICASSDGIAIEKNLTQ